MKKILFLLSALIIAVSSFAQAPQGINYQGVARNSMGAAISKANIGVQFKIHQGGTSGTIVYSEVYPYPTLQTDTFGLYTIVIGSASGSGFGSFASIPWSGGNLWIEVLVDDGSGTGLQSVANTQLQSVPYALYSGGSSSGVVSINANPAQIVAVGTQTVDLSLATTSVTAATYGDASHYPIVTVDPYGRITGASNQTIPTAVSQSLSLSGNTLGISGGNTVTLPTATSTVLVTAPLSGDGSSGSPISTSTTIVAGTVGTASTVPIITYDQYGRITAVSSQTVNASQLQGQAISVTPPSLGQVLTYTAGQWAPASPPSGTIGPWTLSSNQLFPTAYLTDLVGIGNNNPSYMLDITNTNNPNGGLNVQNNFTNGTAGIFANTNAANGNVVLDVSTTGGGNAINATAISGYALSGVTGNAPALWVKNNSSGSGSATIVSKQLNANGYSGSFSGGLGLQTDLIQITNGAGTAGQVLTSDASGNGTWQPIPGSITSIIAGTGITTSTATGGVVTVSANAGTNLWNANQLQNVGISTAVPTNGQILQYNGGQWIPSPPPVAGASNGLMVTTGSVVLGGNLTNTTTISQGANNLLLQSSTTGNVQISNANNTNGALAVTNISTAGGNALNVTSNGTGNTIVGTNLGTSGNAASFINNSSSNGAAALNAYTGGTGNAITATSGSGSAINATATTGGAIQASNTGGAHTISGTNNGTGGNAGYFVINNAGSGNDALHASTNGSGNAINATSVSGTAINASNSGGNTISAQNTGTTGGAGNFTINSGTNNTAALSASTNGGGNTAVFSITNPVNSNYALNASTNGSGAAIWATNTGSGSGIVASIPSGNSSPAIFALTNGGGNSAKFQINNSGNTADAIFSTTNGSGSALSANNTGSGSAIIASNTAGNSSAVITATSNGTGNSAKFTGGAGMQTDGMTASIVNLTANTTLNGTNYFVLINTAGLSITLPLANTNQGRIYVLMNPTQSYTLISQAGGGGVASTAGVTVVASGGSAVITAATGIIRLVSDGTNWREW